MRMLRIALSVLLLGAVAAPASADLVTYTFDFTSTAPGSIGQTLDGTTSGSYGITQDFEGSPLTLQINASSTGGSFYQGLGGNFGITNAKFDTGEVMSFDFALLPSEPASNLKFSILSIGSFGGDNTAVLTHNSDSYTFSGAGPNDNVDVNLPFNLTDNFAFEVGSQGTNGIFLKSLTIQIASVPEPTAFLFGSLVAGSVGTVMARRRKRAA